nr:LPXTG cell wall anchor domain-containing protein [Lactobacillus amylovorus]
DGKQLTFDSDSSVDQHFVVHLKHGTVTVTPDDKNPVEPGDKINPNDPDPNSPKYQDDVKHDNLAKDAKQTIHYEGAGTDTPADNVTTQKDAFTRTVTYDKVTGKSTTSKWSKTKTTFDKVDNPVVKGYTTKNKQAGGLTATPEDPEVTDTVVYTPNGSIVPVDPNGNPIPGTHPVPYETDPTDPTKVVDGKVPEVPGWTPKNGAPVKPSDPTKDTEVPYDHTMTPGETTATGKVEGLPEKPAKSAKAPAEKLVKTPVKAPKTVKTAEPAKTISIKESAQAQDQLPQTGEDNSKAAFGLGLASILGGIGILGAFKRKKKEN